MSLHSIGWRRSAKLKEKNLNEFETGGLLLEAGFLMLEQTDQSLEKNPIYCSL